MFSGVICGQNDPKYHLLLNCSHLWFSSLHFAHVSLLVDEMSKQRTVPGLNVSQHSHTLSWIQTLEIVWRWQYWYRQLMMIPYDDTYWTFPPPAFSIYCKQSNWLIYIHQFTICHSKRVKQLDLLLIILHTIDRCV